MKCPHCERDDSMVSKTEKHLDTAVIKRYRGCGYCLGTWISYEFSFAYDDVDKMYKEMKKIEATKRRRRTKYKHA